jgi:hypothetical protein
MSDNICTLTNRETRRGHSIRKASDVVTQGHNKLTKNDLLLINDRSLDCEGNDQAYLSLSGHRRNWIQTVLQVKDV